MEAPIPWTDQWRQCVEIGGLELRQLPVLEEGVDDWMVGPQLFQHVGLGRRRPAFDRPLEDRQSKLLVQDRGQLRRRADIEPFPGVSVDVFLEGPHAIAQAL